MFFVKVYLDKSKINGIGLFAGQNIKKDVVIYQSNQNLDLLLSNIKFKKLKEFEKKVIKHYGYQDKITKKWHLAFDDIRFCNHSINGNLTKKINSSKDYLIAKRDIRKGEEILQNYNEFENLRNKLR